MPFLTCHPALTSFLITANRLLSSGSPPPVAWQPLPAWVHGLFGQPKAPVPYETAAGMFIGSDTFHPLIQVLTLTAGHFRPTRARRSRGIIGCSRFPNRGSLRQSRSLLKQHHFLHSGHRPEWSDPSRERSSQSRPIIAAYFPGINLHSKADLMYES